MIGLVDDRQPPVSRRNGRRRNGPAGRTPAELFRELPALALFERIPLPAVAIERDGAILAANAEFAALIGLTPEVLTPPILTQAVGKALIAESLVALENCRTRIVDLTHAEGWTVRAKMSKSPLWHADDAVVLVILEDMTERLWIDGP
jgi:PAS domain-containing protein